MGFDKEGSKSGVGGFFNLFDWTAKSRKKLFSNKSDFPDHSKQGKRSHGNLPTTRLSLIDDDNEIGYGSSFKGSGDFSCASSITDEDGFGGSRAPSVVARLMGLDSLPTSNLQEPYSTPFFDTRSLQDSQFHKKNFEYYNGNMVKKSDGQSSRSFVEPKHTKSTVMTPSRPIEKFQTEILPPKSAKSIPITHHKLLSPIKSPGFIPSNDAAHIMEAAAKIIIDHGPQYHVKPKMPLLGSSSSSVPLKVQALREKVEASSAKSEALQRTRPVESNAVKCLKGQSMTKSWSGSVDMSFKPSLDKEESTSGVTSKAKSISLAIQAKVNVQKREGLSQSTSRSEVSERQQSESKSSSPTFRSQQSSQKGLNSNRPSTQKSASGVLRQNNQKQNSQVDNSNSVSKPLVSNSQSRKLLSRDSSTRQKSSSRNVDGSSKSGTRKSSLLSDSEKDAPYSSSARNFPRKKRSNTSNDKSLSAQNQKPVKASSATDLVEESRRKGIDVVSFTFTSPLTRPLCGPESSGKRVLVDSDGVKLSSLGYNVIGGDALSLLLEEKLRELTIGLESSGSTSHLEDVVTEKKKDKFNAQFEFGFSTTGGPKQSFQGLDKMDESISPVSILEPSFSNESYESSLTLNSTEGSKLCYSSVQAQEVNNNILSFPKKFNPLEADTELSDSASSTISSTATKFNPTNYVKKILSNVELMFDEFALGRSREVINPHLFDLLECREKRTFESVSCGDDTRLKKKVLFDCVSECVDLRCKQCVGGGYKTWIKGVEMVRRKERLAEEVHQEICGLEKLNDSMVDELVDKDMSNKFGKWVDFDFEESELGVDLEAQIFDSLIYEIVVDMF